MTLELHPPAPPTNDEEPSLDSMDRLWAALDAALDPDDTTVSLPPRELPPADDSGCIWCRRCGYGRLWGRWTPRVAHPRGCPACHSAYHDIPAMTSRGKTPDMTDIAHETRRRRERNQERKRYRHLAMVKALAKELELSLIDPRTDRVLVPRQRKPRPEPSVPLVFRRTVPPPPGMEDV